MAYDPTCFYCAKDQRLSDLMIPVSTLQVSTLYLFREQTHPGRCIVALNDHVSELFLLNSDNIKLFTEDLAKAAKAIHSAFNPGKINYAAYGDKVTHLHFHLVPKYENGPKWGEVFEMMPADKIYLKDTEYQAVIEKIKNEL